ncbi:hypothetical protein [Salimicrobium flavidum]|uniref:Uncharacterized protein n=1 Tax=Salimicrobium flavidum TaxID=570947 RepID=A0A1N7KTB2_9BACI|nr:hypothetical protein [Salimicrobium flavidum]SIS64862.1 hypothetical protein SAMN05421687_1187 [Salimicrobium flavidum]
MRATDSSSLLSTLSHQPSYQKKVIPILTKRQYLRFPIGDTYVVIEILGEDYFYARATFSYMPYQVEGTDLNKVVGTILRRIKSDNRDFYAN